MFSSGWCAAGGRPPWWQGAAVLSDRETLFLRSGIEGHPEAGCFQLQRRCGFHLQTHRGLLVNSNEPLEDGGCLRDSSKKSSWQLDNFLLRQQKKKTKTSLHSTFNKLIIYNRTRKVKILNIPLAHALRTSRCKAQCVHRNKATKGGLLFFCPHKPLKDDCIVTTSAK